METIRKRGRPSLGKTREQIQLAERERLRAYYAANCNQVCERRRVQYHAQKHNAPEPVIAN